MIISKSALQIANLCVEESGPLSYVCIEPDGKVVAGNDSVMAAVSSSPAEVRRMVPMDDWEERGRILLTAKTTKELIKRIPADKQFKGILEHVAIAPVAGNRSKAIVRYTNGMTVSEDMIPRKPDDRWIEYRSMFAAMMKVPEGYAQLRRFVVNRKRLSMLILAMDRVCAYDGKFAVTGIEFSASGAVVLRAFHELLGLKMIAVTMGEVNPEMWFQDWGFFEREIQRKGAQKIV